MTTIFRIILHSSFMAS